MNEIFWSSSDEEDSDSNDQGQGQPSAVPAVAPVASASVADAEVQAKRQKGDDGAVVIHRLSAADKTGLEGTADRIAAVMANQRKGAFGRNEEKREERVAAKVKKLRQRVREVKAEEGRPHDVLARARTQSVNRELAEVLAQLGAWRDLSHTVLCIDMDAFYVACELVQRPELRGLPVAVGGNSMLSTSSYEARKFGVRSAMPGYIAKQLCPELIILPSNFTLYTEAARQIREVFAQYDPDFTSMSLDEAALDITAHLRAHPEQEAEEVARAIKAQIFERTHCTASIGIAANKSLAKICSNINKPDGLYRLPHDEESIVAFVRKLPLRKIAGIGPVTEAVLSGGLGIATVQDLWDQRQLLARISKKDSLQYYVDVALGFPSSSFEEQEQEHDRKSISTERTVGAEGIDGVAASLQLARGLCSSLAEDVAKAQVRGKTVTLVLKGTDFQRRSRAQSVAVAVSTADELWRAVKRLVEEFQPEVGPFRLMGVRLSALSSAP